MEFGIAPCYWAQVLREAWSRFWMRRAGLSRLGRLATRLATWSAPPYKARLRLAQYAALGYFSPTAIIQHRSLHLGQNLFVGDRVVIFQGSASHVRLGNRVHLYSDIIIETGAGGSVDIGDETHIQPGCRIMGYAGCTRIGQRVEMAPNCAFYPYNHGIEPDRPIRSQPLRTKGGIRIGDDVWLGFGVIVLDGVQVGDGAVIGAGSVVTRDVPAGAIAAGNPARIIGRRGEQPLVGREPCDPWAATILARGKADGQQP